MTIVFDGHNDTLTDLYLRKGSQERSFFEAGRAGPIDFPRAPQGGLAGGFFAIFTSPPATSPESDPKYGLTFSEQRDVVSERSALDPGYAQTFTDSVIRRPDPNCPYL